MKWIRQTLRQNRVFILVLLLLETLFLPGLRPIYGSGERERTLTSRLERPLPLNRVEKKARTRAGTAVKPGAVSSALAPASVPRRVIAKDAVAPEITALAASLGDSPGEIFRYVHDHVDFDPKWGAGRSPLGTLWEGRGSSWDQAWLLLELLTAAGVDARF